MFQFSTSKDSPVLPGGRGPALGNAGTVLAGAQPNKGSLVPAAGHTWAAGSVPRLHAWPWRQRDWASRRCPGLWGLSQKGGCTDCRGVASLPLQQGPSQNLPDTGPLAATPGALRVRHVAPEGRWPRTKLMVAWAPSGGWDPKTEQLSHEKQNRAGELTPTWTLPGSRPVSLKDFQERLQPLGEGGVAAAGEWPQRRAGQRLLRTLSRGGGGSQALQAGALQGLHPHPGGLVSEGGGPRL